MHALFYDSWGGSKRHPSKHRLAALPLAVGIVAAHVIVLLGIHALHHPRVPAPATPVQWVTVSPSPILPKRIEPQPVPVEQPLVLPKPMQSQRMQPKRVRPMPQSPSVLSDVPPTPKPTDQPQSTPPKSLAPKSPAPNSPLPKLPPKPAKQRPASPSQSLANHSATPDLATPNAVISESTTPKSAPEHSAPDDSVLDHATAASRAPHSAPSPVPQEGAKSIEKTAPTSQLASDKVKHQTLPPAVDSSRPNPSVGSASSALQDSTKPIILPNSSTDPAPKIAKNTKPDTPVKTDATAGPPSPKSVTNGELAYLVAPEARYPRSSRANHESGSVLLDVTFSPTGQATRVDVLESSGFEALDDAARQAARKAKIHPYLDNGRAITVITRMPIHFALED